MVDPWAAALAVLHSAPGSVAATYQDGTSASATAVRVVRSTAALGADVTVGDYAVNADSTLIEVPAASLPAPIKGGWFVLETGETFDIVAVPRMDVERITWTCEVAEQP